MLAVLMQEIKMFANGNRTPSSESRTQYRPPVTYVPSRQQTRNEPRQSSSRVSGPSGSGEKVYYPQVCNCAELQTAHYHPKPHRVIPKFSDPQVSRQVFEPPETTSLEPEIDIASTSPNPTSALNNIAQIDIIRKLANLLLLGGPPTGNGGLQDMNPEMADDARWTETMTHLTLEMGKGYLPYEQPVPVPTSQEVMTDGKCRGYVEDKDGPPVGSRWHDCWKKESAISDKIKYATALYVADYETVSQSIRRILRTDPLGSHYPENAEFCLPLEWREKLYSDLFCPISVEVENGRIRDSFIEAVIESKVLVIRYIECFLLRVWVELRVEPFPGLKGFVEDFEFFSKILMTRIKYKQIPKSIRFDQITLWTNKDSDSGFAKRWSERFENTGSWGKIIGDSESIRRHYVCGLLDVMFGIWLAPGRCLFHDGWLGERANVATDTDDPWRTARWVSAESTVPRCIQNGLYFWEVPPPVPDTAMADQEDEVLHEASISLAYLDACFIEYRGPYRFKRASRLSEHLTVIAHSGHMEILIYTDWKRLLMLRHHKVLVEDAKAISEEVSMVQLLSRSRRKPGARRYGLGGDVRYIAYELLHTYELLFWRGVSERNADGHGYLYHHTHTLDMRLFTNSSERIAIDTLQMNDVLEAKEEIRAMFSSPEQQ
jgi:hypothetical protein